MNHESDMTDSLLLELRRGVIVLSVLSQLFTPKYGYSLMQSLEEKGIPVDAGTLYPLLRRLEKQELLVSEWETGGAKPRKYYTLSEKGKQVYHNLCEEWTAMSKNVNQLIHDGEDDRNGTH